MDTFTHGIAGALMAKAALGGGELFPRVKMSKRSLVTGALTLGAIFPDADVFRDMISRDPLLVLSWHRSITHSLLCLPFWAVLLAALTASVARWRKWEASSFVALTGLFALGILSHIFLDLVTTFGTMIWSPLEWSRPAWDILFIIDFTFTAIVLIPQLVAWAYGNAERMRWRALLLWAVLAPGPYLVSRIGANVGAPVSSLATLVATVVLMTLALLPLARGWGLRVPYAAWSRVGLAVAAGYIAAAAYAHHAALDRMRQFAAQEGLQVQTIGALPLPPSLWHWDGLVRAPRGVYEVRMDLNDGLERGPAPVNAEALEHTYYPDAFPNEYIAEARRLPEVQKVLWFARFPVTRFHRESGDAVVEFSDLRFAQLRRDRAAPFTYRVRFSGDGRVLSQGWSRQ
jgi:membrane-bound metal-dependent hydrolase YbcI (DUF457 family)